MELPTRFWERAEMDVAIRECTQADLEAIFEVVNDAAGAYRGVIPADRWHEPYMSRAELLSETESGVRFWGAEAEGRLLGVMGIQDKGKVCLIRHAYVRTVYRQAGIGSRLLRHLEALTTRPILIGTWAAASWALRFYEKNGYRLLPEDEKTRLLHKYWKIPERQVETSVVLADRRWAGLGKSEA